MPGLTDRAAASASAPTGRAAEAQRTWEAALLAQVERLREDLRSRMPDETAANVGARLLGTALLWPYWGREVEVAWPALQPTWVDDGTPCSAFDTAMLLYHLRASDGMLPADTWIAFRELPNGGFYYQAFTGYTGQRWAKSFGTRPEAFAAAAQRLGGESIAGLGPYAFRFVPLPRIPLAACLWPGDEDLPAQAAVLFDALAGHHLPTDGLALLGSGLTGRLLRADS